MPPTWKKFGLGQSVFTVRAVHPVREFCLTLGQESLDLGSCLVCGFYMKIKGTSIFSYR